MTLQEAHAPCGLWREVMPERQDLATRALAGLFPTDLFLEHLLDRIEERRP
mgnify:CR=1 FL=1